MPELPEVETVRRSLTPHIVGRHILNLRITDFPGVLGDADATELSSLLRGKEIVTLRRRGKYLLLDLDDESALVIHLRMTGNLVLTDRSAPSLRFERLVIELDGDRDLRFADQRKFGRVVHMLPADLALLDERIGPEPLDDRFTAEALRHLLHARGAPLKSVLLDQHVVAGLGNIYVDEALFRARVHPLRPANSLTAEEFRRLHRAIRTILREGIANRGTSISSFRDGSGREGTNQNHLQVYGRGRRGEPCPRCGHPLSYIVIAGRSSHFCPHCQPATQRL